MFDRLDAEISILDRHLRVLQCVQANEPIGIHNTADALDLPQHKARYSLRVLEDHGLIAPTAKGATTTDETEAFVAELDAAIDELLVRLDAVWEVRR